MSNIPIQITVRGMDQIYDDTIDKEILDKIIEHPDINNYALVKVDGKDVYQFEFLMEDVDWKATSGKHAACCAYVATEAFLRHNLGRVLDSNDRTWYVNHPNVIAPGLKENKSFETLQALVRPYNVAVSEILVKRGRVLQNCGEWMKGFGMDPISINDPRISHEEAIRKIYGRISEEAVRTKLANLPRMRVVDEVEGPVIVFAAGGKNRAVAIAGGHASYLGPRQKSSSFEYAIRYEIITPENKDLHYAMPMRDYDRHDLRVPNFRECKFNDKTLHQWGIKTSYFQSFSNRENHGTTVRSFTGWYGGITMFDMCEILDIDKNFRKNMADYETKATDGGDAKLRELMVKLKSNEEFVARAHKASMNFQKVVDPAELNDETVTKFLEGVHEENDFFTRCTMEDFRVFWSKLHGSQGVRDRLMLCWALRWAFDNIEDPSAALEENLKVEKPEVKASAE